MRSQARKRSTGDTIGRYQPPVLDAGAGPLQPRSTRYYHRDKALIGLDQLLLLGKLDEAVTFTLPFLARIEGAPVIGTKADLCAAKALADGREDVALEQWRAGAISDDQFRAVLLAELQRGLALYRLTFAGARA